MSPRPTNAHERPRHLLRLLAVGSLLLGACRDPKIASYRVAKDRASPPPATSSALPSDHPRIDAGSGTPASAAAAPAASATMPAGHGVATAAGTGLAWTAPAHWQPKAGSSMRKGTYALTSDGGATAELAITAFPGDVGGEPANVNRWRGQLQLAPLPDAEAAAAITRLGANGLAIGVVEVVNPPARMLGAMVPFEGATWFFKLTGADALVAKEKPAFLEFVKTIKAAPAVERVAPSAPSGASPDPKPAR